MDIRFGIAKLNNNGEGTTLIETSTIIFCPFCGTENYIGSRTCGSTTGIIYCVKCRQPI